LPILQNLPQKNHLLYLILAVDTLSVLFSSMTKLLNETAKRARCIEWLISLTIVGSERATEAFCFQSGSDGSLVFSPVV
jgi:hypothetical protein